MKKAVADSFPPIAYPRERADCVESTTANSGNQLTIKTRIAYESVTFGFSSKSVTLERGYHLDFDTMKELAARTRETNPDLVLDITATVKL